MNARELERRSSAVTLSDMEIFIFPELMYGLVLADILSPRIWAWRGHPWFDGVERMKPYRRITRLKQFVMDHYVFNLDLETWGLTTKERELERFRNFIDERTLAQSNALFGYEGDKYYFDIDIRTHFGLDKYTSETIPYWKTETVEAMDAFKFKPGYRGGAGECVSLAALYAAALFVVARIPLEDIYLLATPLHSQNFVDVDDGILTNNRRLVTKKMWFNGTALSDQARRALENERVTVVAHAGGWIHGVYPRATVDPARYARFRERLESYLRSPLDAEMLGSFLRHRRDLQHCFQYRCLIHGSPRYIPLERVFAYEEGSPYLLTDRTREKLLDEIDREEFQPAPLSGRAVFNDLEDYVREKPVDAGDPAVRAGLMDRFASDCLNAREALRGLFAFCHTEPRLPDASAKTFSAPETPLGLRPEMDRSEVEERLESIRATNQLAETAFWAYRDLGRVDPRPFLYAALTRNPVGPAALEGKSPEEAYGLISGLENESIYDGPRRLAQPDEVWNYGRGEGVEKALLMAAFLRNREGEGPSAVSLEGEKAVLRSGGSAWTFSGTKGLAPAEWELPW